MSVSFSHDIQYQISSPINSTGRVLTLASAATGLYVTLEPDTKDDAQQWVFWASETTSGFQIENYKYDTYYISKEGTTGLLNSAKETMDWYIFPEEGTSDYRICQDAGCALAWTPYSLAGGPSSSSQVYVIAPGGGASDLWRIVPIGSTPSVTTTSTTSAQISTALPTTATFTVINNPTSTTPSIPLSTETSALSKEDQNVVQECCGEAKSKCKFKSSGDATSQTYTILIGQPVENCDSASQQNVVTKLGGSFELQHSFSYQVTTNGGLGFAGSAIGGALLANETRLAYFTTPGMSEGVEDLAGTYGALLLGGLVSASLSGVVVIQTLIYYKLFPCDAPWRKLLVLVILLMDITHSGMVWAGIWVHLISRGRTLAHVDFIPLSLTPTPLGMHIEPQLHLCGSYVPGPYVSSSFTRLARGSSRNEYTPVRMPLQLPFPLARTKYSYLFPICLEVHGRNWKWLVTTPIAALAAARLGFACVTSIQMIRLESFAAFVRVSSWTFTLGLALSSSVDVLVTVSLFVLLRENGGKEYLRLGHIIDSLVLYTVEIGSMTCTVTIISLICWLTMRNNLIFMGLHFIIGKLYANSMLATLNTRRGLRLTQRRMINELDASAIVREDLRLHFRTPMTQSMNTIQEEILHASGVGGSSFTVTMSKAGVSVAELPVELERISRDREREDGTLK
ncbi:hypothetical protein NMY22_g1453 [Coprinellus aureogranulatus]|nr:hypothetical protein NMY22_g1453 [Coprinellus aureogranulatus]